jgi:hypothetical protein
MKRKLLCLVLLSLTSPLAAADRISVVRLIGAGEKYQEKQVVVSGFLAVDANGSLDIFLDEASAKAGVTVNSVVLDLGRGNDKYNGLIGKYVQVDGTFVYYPRDVNYAGVLRDIGVVNDYPLVKQLPVKK